MSITESKLNDVTLVRNTVTNTYELHLLLITLANTYNHVVNKCAIKTMESLLLLDVNRAVLVDLKFNLTVLDSHLDRGVNLLCQPRGRVQDAL